MKPEIGQKYIFHPKANSVMNNNNLHVYEVMNITNTQVNGRNLNLNPNDHSCFMGWLDDSLDSQAWDNLVKQGVWELYTEEKLTIKPRLDLCQIED
jgi:hypothetical protein